MVQQQIVGYAKSQLKLGVRIDAIKGALLGAGWAEADVSDSLRVVDSDFAAGQSKEPAKQANIDISSIFGVKPDIKRTSLSSGPLNEKPVAAVGVKTGFSLPGKPIDKKDGAKVLGEIFGKTGKFISASKSHLGERMSATIILVVVAAISSFAAVWFYIKSGKIEDELAVLRAGGDLSIKVAELSSRVEALDKEAKSLTGQLLFFARASDISEAEISDLGGILVGNSGRYLLVTRLGTVITIENSKDKDVDAALAPRVGKEVEIGGTYVPGSGVITATTVDGKPIKEVEAAQ